MITKTIFEVFKTEKNIKKYELISHLEKVIFKVRKYMRLNSSMIVKQYLEWAMHECKPLKNPRIIYLCDPHFSSTTHI